jgi:hypothetical protein
MSLEQENKIVEVKNPISFQKAQQLYRASQRHEEEKQKLWERNNKPYSYTRNHEFYVRITPQFLFGWWLVIQTLIKDIDMLEGKKIGNKIWEGGGGTKRPNIPEAFTK